jgi:hypothetical protein
VTASIVGDPSKTYDGNANATLSSSNFSLSNLVSGESFTVTQTSGTYNSAHVASATTVTASLSSSNFTAGSGTLASDYSLPSSASGQGTITARTVTASITGDPSKVYDGNANATLTSSNFSLSNLVSGESFTVTQTSGTYNSAHVASATTVTASLSASQFSPASGTLASDYSLPSSASGQGTITARTVTASIVGDPSKTYDGNANATLTSSNFSLSNLVSGESFTVTQTSGTYNSAHVASASTVTASLSSSNFTAGSGTLASDYSLPSSASGQGTITARTVTASIVGDPSKTYDGTTGATLTSSNFSLSNLVSGESFTVTQTSGSYNSAHVASASTVTANLSSSNFTAGSGTLASDYSLPTSASGAGAITPATPVFSNLTASQTTAYGTASVTLLGTILGNNVVPPGSVSVSAGGAAASGNIGGNGAFTVTLPTSGLTASTYTITYSYHDSADSDFKDASNTSTTLTISPAGTTTTAASQTVTYSTSGQTLTLTATVSNKSTTAAVNEGTVTFTVFSGSTQIGSGVTSSTVTGGSASASYTLPASTMAGTYTINAVYNAGKDFATSSDTTHTLTVNAAGTTTTAVNETANFSSANQTVTLSATITSAVGAVNEGTVTFTIYNGSTQVGGAATSGTVSGGNASASYTLPGNTAAGTYTIQAVYSDTSGADFTGSSDNSHTLTVVNAVTSTTTTGTASPSPASFGQSVTLKATVTGSSSTPTGTVDFYDTTTATDLGSVSLSGGSASLMTAVLPVGSNTITLSYGGDSKNLKSSGTVTVTVNQAVIVLDPSASGALTLSGNASITMAGNVTVDSSSTSAVQVSNTPTIKANAIQVVGGVKQSGSPTFQPKPVTGAAAVADPLTGLPAPAAVSTSGLTNYGSENIGGSTTMTLGPGIYSQISVSGSASVTLTPGTYDITGNLSVSAPASVTFKPGTYAMEVGGIAVSGGVLALGQGMYIVTGGGFAVSGGKVTGSGVTIYNGGSNFPNAGGKYGAYTVSGSGSLSLSPPTTGAYAGIAVDQPAANTTGLSLSGSGVDLTGVVYAPKAALVLSGTATLNASLVVDTLTITGSAVANVVTLNSPTGTVAYTPAQIRTAYGINQVTLDGTGQTIALVDAYDNPAVFQSLDQFDTQFGLTDSGPSLYDQYGPAASFLTVLNQNGQADSLPATDPSGAGVANWESEIALDVEWTHAIAPGAKIILVEANSQSLADLMAGVATAAHQPGVSVVSMSWGFPESQAVFAEDEATYDSYFQVPGVTFVASTGDFGTADAEYPAFSPNVVAVGGTTLNLNADSSYQSETGWGYFDNSLGSLVGSGGGLSHFEPEPAYQLGVQSTGARTTPDVSLVADPHTGAWIADPYNLPTDNPFEVVGGTSLSAPSWAGLIALANQGRVADGLSTLNSVSPTSTQQALYGLPQSDFNVIQGGNNGYSAGPNYNLVTGLGTPVANLLVYDLAAYQESSSGSASTGTVQTVGPIQSGNLVYSGTGTTDSGGAAITFNAFNVFNFETISSQGYRSPLSLAPTTGMTGHTPAPANLIDTSFTAAANLAPDQRVSSPTVGNQSRFSQAFTASVPNGLAGSRTVGVDNYQPNWGNVILDAMTVAPGSSLSTRLAVGPADLRQSSGGDALIGGDGDDLLIGDQGRDYLIGGIGRSRDPQQMDNLSATLLSQDAVTEEVFDALAQEWDAVNAATPELLDWGQLVQDPAGDPETWRAATDFVFGGDE